MGVRSDGFHEISSLVAFTEFGDWMDCRPGKENTLTASGPFAGCVPLDQENLVLQAARLASGAVGYNFSLDKRIPVSAGLGGGSSNAATAIRLVARISGMEVPETERTVRLGSDVPVCLHGKPAMARGRGEIITPLRVLPKIPLLLVNPLLALPTGDVYRSLDQTGSQPLECPPESDSLEDLIDWLSCQGNDLEKSAIGLRPEISTVLEVIDNAGDCLLARMSGSGATCIGIYRTEDDTREACRIINSRNRDWWVVPTFVPEYRDPA